MKIFIRAEQPEDRGDIRLINEAAFGRREEAQIVDMLRDSCGDLLSLVAVVEEQTVGHILFSPVTVEGAELHPPGMGLAAHGRASRYGLHCQWAAVPGPAYMILVFDEPALKDISGVARYRDEFDRGI